MPERIVRKCGKSHLNQSESHQLSGDGKQCSSKDAKKEAHPFPPFFFLQICLLGWSEKAVLRGLPQGPREETITKGFKQVNYKCKLSYGSKSPHPFSNKDFSTPNLVLWMLQILTFNNHVRQQSRDARGICCGSENLRAPAAFHKDSLIC